MNPDDMDKMIGSYVGGSVSDSLGVSVADRYETLTYDMVNNAAKAMEYESSSTLDLFETQFENKYKVSFSDVMKVMKAKFPELKI